MTALAKLQALLQDPPPGHVFEISETGVAAARLEGAAPEVNFYALPPGALAVSPLKDNVANAEALQAAVHTLAGEAAGKKRRAALILPEAESLAEDWHQRRLDLRPGMTGPWQINGRSQTPFQEMLRFDYQYVAGWSLGRDLEILLGTVPAVLSRRGAY